MVHFLRERVGSTSSLRTLPKLVGVNPSASGV